MMRSSLAHTMKGKRIHTTAINSPQMTQSMTERLPTKLAGVVCAIIVVIVSFLFFEAKLLHAGVPQAHAGSPLSLILNKLHVVGRLRIERFSDFRRLG